MCAIYAWMRQLDDLADDASSPANARTAIESWRARTHRAFPSQGLAEEFQDGLWPALSETVHRYAIPHGHFDEIVEGALMDQEITRYETFEDLYRYCYRVASTVGLVCLRVFEYKDPQAEKTGEWLGIAFQLTNILRDMREDAGRGRLYIPLEDLRRHGVSETDLLEFRWNTQVHDLLVSFGERAEEYYIRAGPIADMVSGEARPTLRIMTEIYHGILLQAKKLDFRVFEHRAQLPAWKKLFIVAKHQFRFST